MLFIVALHFKFITFSLQMIGLVIIALVVAHDGHDPVHLQISPHLVSATPATDDNNESAARRDKRQLLGALLGGLLGYNLGYQGSRWATFFNCSLSIRNIN